MPEYLDSTYDLTADTYTAKEQSFAVCEVGDAKEPTAFYPQVKITRWENEANFSVRLVHDEAAPTVITEAGKIKWVGRKVEAHFYDTGSLKEDEGGYEFEIVLKEPPKSNVIQFTIQTKGLNFFYQPPLTPEEIAEGAARPENVVGSYAVYHQTMTGDYTALGGKNYQAGKAFHIYRPRIEDAKGNWCWGDLNIDEKAGLLTVTIPQEFLDKAVYPIRHAAGLEFGYHTVGGSNESQYWTYLLASERSQVNVNGTISKIHAYIQGISPFATYLYLSVYRDSGGEPSNLIVADNIGVNISDATWKWWDSHSLSGNLVSGNYYWNCWFVEKTGNNSTIKYDTVTNSSRVTGSLGVGTCPPLPTTFPTHSNNSKRYSLYVEYSQTASGGIPPVLLFPQSQGAV